MPAAEQRQCNHSELFERFGHQLPAVRQVQQPAASQADPGSDQHTVAKLFDHELSEARLLSHRPGLDQREEEQQEWNGQPVVQTGFDVERLANAQRHTRTVYDDLSEPASVERESRRGCPLPRSIDGETLQRAERAQQNCQQHPRAQQAGGQVPNVLQHLQVGAAGVREEQ